MTDALTFATLVARQVGGLLVAHFDRGGIQGSLKADDTIVTKADLDADEFIRNAIQEDFPSDGILSEENSTIYPRATPEVWVIDPLDGTTNYSLGLHYWGVAITRLVNGYPDTTAIYFPLLDEMYTAQRGGGTFLNNVRLRVQTPNGDKKTTFFSCCSRTHQNYYISVPYKTRILGSAVYGICSIARGSSLLAFEVTPKIWDIAGSWLVVQEAGGIIQTFSGTPPFPPIPNTDYVSKEFPILAAATSKIASKGRRWITPKN